MSVYARIVHMHESKDYILRPLFDGQADAPPVLSWWGRGVSLFNDPGIVEGGPATTSEVAGLLDDRLHPAWESQLRGGASLDQCRLGKKPQTFPSGVGRAAVSGISANIAPSKSVSMLMVAGDQHLAHFVAATHLDAVRAALDFLQDYGDIARYGSDLIGLVGVLDQRYTSKVGNPHLSTTATIANVAPRTDGKWIGPDTRELLRWMNPVGTYVETYLLRTLSLYPSLEISTAVGDGLPVVTCGVIDAEMCQRYSSDSSTRRPRPAARGLASAVTSTRLPHTDTTLTALRQRIHHDTEPVTLGERRELPTGTDQHLDQALRHAAHRLRTHLTTRSQVSTHYLMTSALAGLTLAGPVDSSLDRDVQLLVTELAGHPDFRDRIYRGARARDKDRASVAPVFR